MKATVLLLLCILTITSNANAQQFHDLRVVNGITLDLGPVHEWLAHPKGEQPMKHWRQVVVFAIGSKFRDLDRCFIAGRGLNSTQEVFVANMPKDIKDRVLAFQQSVQETAQAIIALRMQLPAAEQMRDAFWDRYVYSDGWISTITAGTGGTSTSSDSDATRLANARAGDKNLVMMREQLALLEKIQREQFAALKNIDRDTNRSVLAMFSGRKYDKLEVWDCGRPK
jgi:hypothetical protein